MPKVVVDGVEYRPVGAMDVAVDTPKVGDFVQVKSGVMANNEGAYGKVIGIDQPFAGGRSHLVEFAEPFEAGHNGGGKTKYRHGWWYYANELSIVD